MEITAKFLLDIPTLMAMFLPFLSAEVLDHRAFRW